MPGTYGDPDRLAEIQERIAAAERRCTEIYEQQVRLEDQRIDERTLREALEKFTPIWSVLTPRERKRVVRLLVERVAYDGRSEELAITYRPAGFRLLAGQLEEAAA